MLPKYIQLGPWKVQSEEISYFLYVITVLEADGVDVFSNVGFIRRSYRSMAEQLSREEDLVSFLRQVSSISLDEDVCTIFGHHCKTVEAKNQYKCFLSRILLDGVPSSLPGLYDRIVNELEYNSAWESYLSDLINGALPFPLKPINFRKATPGGGAIAERVPRDYPRTSWCEVPVVDRARLALRSPSRASRALDVPKSWKASRGIAPEPFENSLRQGAIADALVEAIEERTPCRIHDQEQNRSHCMRPYATIDQSNASDRIRLHHVKAFLPDWYPILEYHRTKYCYILGKEVPLGTFFATMGSRLSFPVETIIFWRIAAAAILYAGGTLEDLNDLYCYGDDLVCHERFAEEVIRSFELCGFEVNVEKSHYKPNDLYRETCGAETYDGSNVKPVRLPRGTRVNWWGADTDPGALCDFITQLSMRGLWISAQLLSDAAAQHFGIGVVSLSEMDPWLCKEDENLPLPPCTCFSPLSQPCSSKCHPRQIEYVSHWLTNRQFKTDNILRSPKTGKRHKARAVHFKSDAEFYEFFKLWSLFIGYSTADASTGTPPDTLSASKYQRREIDYMRRRLSSTSTDIIIASLNKRTVR
jgi:hypothetical protein